MTQQTIHFHYHFYHNERAILDAITNQGTITMATLAELKAAIDQCAADATAEKTEVTAALQALTDQIAALQAQIDAGDTITAADLDPLVAAVAALDSQVKDITVAAVPPAP